MEKIKSYLLDLVYSSRKNEYEREKLNQSLFSLNQNGVISLPKIGDRIKLSGREDGSLEVELEFLSTYVIVHFYDQEKNRSHQAQWGKFVPRGAAGDPLETAIQHTFVFADTSEEESSGKGKKKKKDTGRIHGTDMYLKFVSGENGITMRLVGPNKEWSLRWNQTLEAHPKEKELR